MSIGLIVEVLDHAPDTLTSGERLVLVVIAEWANDRTRIARQSSNWTIDTICRRAGIKRAGLKSILQGLAKKGLEVRVPVKHKDGKPVYAYEGTAVTFQVPALAQRGGHSIPSEGPRGDATASERGGHSIREGMPQPPPSPQGSPLKKLPSSLSREGATDPGAFVPAQRTERENEDASQKPETHNPIHRLLLDAGCPPGHLDDVEAEMLRRHQPRSPAWWRTVAKAGDLPGLVDEVLEALQPAQPDLTEEHLADAHDFEAKGDGSPSCKHCPFPERNGRHRASGYVSARAVSLDASKKRSTGALRAEQGLRVADELDRQFGHGRWAANGLDEYGNGVRPGGSYHHLRDSRVPNRNYHEPL